ncbi:autotransporter domain-containing protein, partial [Methylobacterium hispanicum]
MADFTVSNTSDSGAGSLRQAIISANAETGASTITFAAGLARQTIIVGSTPLPAIKSDITIDGANAPGLTISGGNANRVFFVLSGTVAIQNLTIADGKATGGQGSGGGMGAGGAIFVNTGTTTVTNVSFANNTAVGGVGTGNIGAGGGGLGGNGGSLTSGGIGGGGGYSGGGGGGGSFNSSGGSGGAGPGGAGGAGGGTGRNGNSATATGGG